MTNLFNSILLSFQSSASFFMWSALLASINVLIFVPLLISIMRDKRGLSISVFLSSLPFLFGIAGFLKILMDARSAMPNIPAPQRAEAYKTVMQIALASLWPAVISILFVLALMAIYFIFIQGKSFPVVQKAGSLSSRRKRLLGSYLDGIILLLLFSPLIVMAALKGQKTDFTVFQQMLLALSGIGLYFLVNGYFLIKNSQTIGKRLLKMKIVNNTDSGNAPVLKIVLLRFGLLVIINLFPYIGSLVGFIDPLFIFGRERRCLHDYWAGTKVVDV
jgi:hypothetical protein